ncbi:uncharacterized protein LOC114541138, partial [Dendronephthya gigantea]|uniref:uncharacterized protein LOC114541138 n=1 Tax=Dendronephthya gigantea TaxID=151771 RepID=UPI00106B99B5
MVQILQSVNLGNLLGRFQEQRMELQTVLSASNQQLVRLCDACKRKVEENNGSTSNTAAVREERLSIFNPRRHNSRSQACVTARSVSSNGANKRAAKSSPWTPTFVCMADTTASKTLSSVEKEILFKAGLGLTKIKLDIQDDEQAVVNKITSDEKDATGNSYGFPQLKTCRGFEMMRCQANCRDLSVIDCSWNAKDLRSNLGWGQGKIYLRPIQKSLSTQPVVVESKSEVKEKCYMCNQDILVRKLRDHLWSCTEVRVKPFVTPLIVQQSINSLDIPDSASPNAHASPVSVNTSAIDSSTISTSSTSNVSSSIVPSLPPITPVIDLTHTTAAAMNNNEKSVDDIVDDTISYCQQHGILNPIEICRYFQSKMVIGRALEVKSIDEASEGATNFI